MTKKPTQKEEFRRFVTSARAKQSERFKKAGSDNLTNAEMSSKECEELINISDEADEFVKTIFDKYPISTRGYYRLLKPAQTIADLEGHDRVEQPHIAEAFQLLVSENRLSTHIF